MTLLEVPTVDLPVWVDVILLAMMAFILKAIINYCLKDRDKFTQRIDEVEKEQDNIRHNYISRFEEVKELINRNNVETLKAIQELQIKVIQQNKAKKTDK